AISAWDSVLAHMIRSMLLENGNGEPRNGVHCVFALEFTSGRRHYSCRVFALNSQANNSAGQPAVALILERCNRKSLDTSQAAARFHLTVREQETLDCLIQGLTNKEIGQRMNISPNTVKAFVKLIMTKMDVSTRSAAIGKAVGPDSKPPSPMIRSDPCCWRMV